MNTHFAPAFDGPAPRAFLADAPVVADPTEGIQIDFRHLWASIYRNRWLILAIIGAALALGVVATVLATRIYSAAASVQIEQQASKVLSAGDTEPAVSGQEADRFLQTQTDILRSRALASRVADDLKLWSNDRFVFRMGGKPSVDVARRRDQVVTLLLDNLGVTLPRSSRIVTVAFKSPDPQLAAQVANAYVTNFITQNLQRRFDASSYARGFLENQLALAKQRLESSERAGNAYAREAGLLDTSAGTAVAPGGVGQSPGVRSLTAANLVQSSDALIQARVQRTAAEGRWREISTMPVLSVPEVQANPAVQQLSQQRATLQAAYQQESLRHGADYPTMRQEAAQIAALDTQITRLATNIRDGIRGQYQAAVAQEASLTGQVGSLKSATQAEQDRSVRYNILKREADTNRTMYDALLQRYKEVSAEAGVTANNISVLDTAQIPNRPVSPRPSFNLLVALLLGLVVSGAVVFARDRFDDAVRAPDEVETKLGLPFLNSIPRLPAGTPALTALEEVRSSFAEAYYALRTSLRLISPNGLIPSLLITSGRESEGKSTTALAVARSFAQIGTRILLIDGDMRRPSLHNYFQAKRSIGFSDLLARQATLSEVTQATEFPNLDFINAGPLPPSPTELLSGNSLRATLDEARGRYDMVVIDGPPVLGLADAVLYADAVEGTIYVVEAGRRRGGSGKAAVRRLAGSGAKLLGAVLTKFDPRHSGYGEEYGYYYSYGPSSSRDR